MSTSVYSVQQQVLHVISQIQCEEIRRARETREINRQKLTLPVAIVDPHNGQRIEAVSRDLSSIGMGLISKDPIQPNAVRELELELETSMSSILSKCLWCEPFGAGYFLSGWRFESLTS